MNYTLPAGTPISDDAAAENFAAVGIIPYGDGYVVAIFYQGISAKPDGWRIFYVLSEYYSAGDLYADVIAQGGIQSYVQGVASLVNSNWYSQISWGVNFTIPNDLSLNAPTDDNSAFAAITEALIAAKFGYPVQMAADFATLWSTVQIGTSLFNVDAAWGGCITKMFANYAMYTDPEGNQIPITPITDLNNLPNLNSYIAAAFATVYDFYPA